MNDPVVDRKRGCLYGLACGDALGAAVEFKSRGSFAPVTCYRSGGPHSLATGQWTDDTSMALALADSIGKVGWDTKDQLQRYLDWWQNGKYSVNGFCFDIGCTTRSALSEFELNGTLESDSDPALSGNGSIMRLAPVVIKYLNDHFFEECLEESSLTTHGSYQCRSACILFGSLLRDLIDQPAWAPDKAQALTYMIETAKGLDYLIVEIANGSYKTKPLEEIKGSGWVVESLEAALWAFNSSNSFEECVLKAVNLGDDADTTGAVAGQLAGAYWGYSGIPQHLIDGLDRKDMIEEACVSLGLHGEHFGNK